MFAETHVSVGIGVGSYGPGAYPPPVYAQQYQPPCPGPGYTWVDGYWTPQSGRNVWIAGYWRAPLVKVTPRRFLPRDDHHDRNWRGDARHDDHHDDRGRGFSNSFRR